MDMYVERAPGIFYGVEDLRGMYKAKIGELTRGAETEKAGIDKQYGKGVVAYFKKRGPKKAVDERTKSKMAEVMSDIDNRAKIIRGGLTRDKLYPVLDKIRELKTPDAELNDQKALLEEQIDSLLAFEDSMTKAAEDIGHPIWEPVLLTEIGGI